MTEVKKVMTACFPIEQIHMEPLMKRDFPPFIPMHVEIQCDILLLLPMEGTSAFTDRAEQSNSAEKRPLEHQADSLSKVHHSGKVSLLFS